MTEESDEILQLRQRYNDFYLQTIMPLTNEFERLRKKHLWHLFIGLFILFVVLPALIVLGFLIILWKNDGNFSGQFDLGYSLHFFVLMVIVAIAMPISKYKKATKNKLMPQFIKLFGNFHYSYMQILPEEKIRKSKLIDDYNLHSGDDFFYGTYKNTEVTVSEEKFIRRVRHHKGSSLQKVFDGILIMLSLNKKFQGQTLVFKDKGFFNAFNSVDNMENVRLEDSVFEKEFEVYSTDQVEARYLLTTAFMERMLKLKEVFKGKKIQFSFFDNILLIAIETKKDMFEATSLFKKASDKTLTDRALEQVISVLSIVDILKTYKN